MIPSIGIISAIVFFYLYFNLESNVKELATSLLHDKANESILELDKFFQPIISNINISQLKGENGDFHKMRIEQFNQHFVASIEVIQPLSSLMLADESGDELMILSLGDAVQNRVTKGSSKNELPRSYLWQMEGVKLKLDSNWLEEEKYDPINRPWYKLAEEGEVGKLYWTKPYKFFTTQDPGVTVSTSFYDSAQHKSILAYDILLSDISAFTTSFNVFKSGFICICKSDNRVIGLPANSGYNSKAKIKSSVLQSKQELNSPIISASANIWEESEKQYGAITFEENGKTWWVYRLPYSLGNETYLVEVFAPERDFLAHIRSTQQIIFIVFIIVIIFTLMLARTLNQRNKLNYLTNRQKLEVEKKNDEILDSIRYAKRIQSAILPPAKIVISYLNNSFIFYLPKDIVAGDFYWMEKVGNKILFAAADCTGHGVPGALMSVLCNNALNRSVREFGLTEPGKILDKTRDLVIEEFEKSEEKVQDGMDIALCSIEENKINFAGANNPLWVLKNNGEFVLVNGNRQPIGNFSEPKPYTTHKLELTKGDSLYIFTDGIQDQFGGPQGKKMKRSGLKRFLLTIQHLTMDEQRKELANFFQEWRGNEEQIDDVCIIGMRIN